MKLEEINNYFGDMDLFLMDAILKGHISERITSVLDVGCGEGRNGIYFMQNQYQYTGWDTDESKLNMLEWLSKSLNKNQLSFQKQELREAPAAASYDLVICSRLLHFASTRNDFNRMWAKLTGTVSVNGLLYVSMDSVVDNSVAVSSLDDLMEFPDGKIRFPLTKGLYKEIKKGFEEVEPLRTIIHHEARAQSFMLLRKK